MENTDYCIRAKEVTQRLSIGRSTLYEWIQKGYFPKPIKLSTHCSVWRESTVNQWLAEKAT